MLQSMGSQRVGHEEQTRLELILRDMEERGKLNIHPSEF